MSMRSLLVLSLIGCLPEEVLRELAAAQEKAKRCPCLPEVRDQQPAVDGRCWNCGKPVGP